MADMWLQGTNMWTWLMRAVPGGFTATAGAWWLIKL